MRQFLRETWQLWYWAHFCPSKLQQRMNEWTPREEKDGQRPDTEYADIFFFHANPRFLAQFFLVLLILSLPLILMIALSGQPLGWWLVIAIPLLAYGVAFWSFLPLALDFPLLFTLLYLANAPLLYETLVKVLALFPPLSRILQAGIMGGLGLMTTSWIGYRLWLAKRIQFGHGILVVGNALSYGGVIWFASQSNILTILIILLVGGTVYLFVNNEARKIEDSGTVAGAVAGAVTGAAVGAVVGAVVGAIGGTVVGAIDVARAGAVAVAGAVGFAAGGVAGGVTGGVTGVVAGVVAGAVVEAVAGVAVVVVARAGAAVIVVARARAAVVVVARAGGVVGGLVGGVVGGTVGAADVVGGLAGAVAVVVVVLASLPLPLLSLAGWLIGSGFATRSQHRWGLGTAILLALLAMELQGWFALFVIPATLIGYYRLLDYFVLSFISLFRTMQIGYNSSHLLFRWLPTLQRDHDMPSERLRYWLHTLPPHSHELLWFRLPGHAHILAKSFKKDSQVGLETLQRMRTSPYPGLPRTARYALPQLVSDQLLAATSVNDVISTATPEHSILPFLVPLLYQPEEEHLSSEALPQVATSTALDAESATMLRRLQRIARDVGVVLEGGSAYLRQRGLEGTLNKLARLQGQLPGMALNASAIARWRAVLEHWQVLIQGEVEQQQAASQGEVLNPFQSGNPLRINQAYLFKGRQRFADNILRQVLNHSRPTLVLHGPRRCGKTSFLRNLPRLLPSDVIPVYLDLQNGAQTSSEADFCYGLVRAMRRNMRSQGLNAAPASRDEFRANPYAALEDWLDQAEELLEERRILFCLDEFEKLGTVIKAGKISLTLFDHLRHLIQHRDELSFLFCGVQTLDDLGPNWSSYFISVQPVEMLYLEANEAKALLEDPDPDFNLGYHTGIVDQVLQLTRCQPYLVQLIGEAMVKQANEQQRRRITPPLLEAALARLLMAEQPYFTNLWHEYTGAPDKPAEVAAGRHVLHALAHKQPLPSPDEIATRNAIRRMERYHVIEQDEAGAYRFEVPLVERWVRERALLE